MTCDDDGDYKIISDYHDHNGGDDNNGDYDDGGDDKADDPIGIAGRELVIGQWYSITCLSHSLYITANIENNQSMILIVDCVISDYDFVDDDGDLKKNNSKIDPQMR